MACGYSATGRARGAPTFQAKRLSRATCISKSSLRPHREYRKSHLLRHSDRSSQTPHFTTPEHFFFTKTLRLFQTLIDPNCCTIVPNTQWLLRVAINHEFIRKTGQINNPQCHRQRLKEDAFRAASRQSAHSHTRPAAPARVKLAGNTTVSEHSLHSTTSERAAS